MTQQNSFQAWTYNLPNREELFPHQIDLIKSGLLLVELPSDDIKNASFLDQRVLKPDTKGQWLPWQTISKIVTDSCTEVSPAFIFHVGHCGSTLLSRLMEFSPDTQSLREPLPLRTLAQDLADLKDGRSFLTEQAIEEHLSVLLKLWGRGASHTVIKATSVCSDLLPHIKRVAPDTKSIFIYNRLQTHVETLLAGQNAIADLKGFAQLRLQRLRNLTGLDIQLNQLSLGQLAALSWLSEVSRITHYQSLSDDRIKLIEFETLLTEPADTLQHLFAHLGIAASESDIRKAIQSPVLQTYSKAPEHHYNAETRAAILTQARLNFSEEIKTAVGWVEELANQSALITASLKRFDH